MGFNSAFKGLRVRWSGVVVAAVRRSKHKKKLLGNIEGKVRFKRSAPKMADTIQLTLQGVRIFRCGPNAAGPRSFERRTNKDAIMHIEIKKRRGKLLCELLMSIITLFH